MIPFSNALAAEPPFAKDSRLRIPATLANVVQALNQGLIECRVAFDEGRGVVIVSWRGEPWREITDLDPIEMRIHLETHHYRSASRRMMNRAIYLAAGLVRLDSVGGDV